MDMISREPIFRVHCEVADILDLGAAPFGHRRVVNLLGGTVYGREAQRPDLPGGTDWQIMAADGSLDIHARYTGRERCRRAGPGRLEGLRHGRPRCWRGSRAARTSIRRCIISAP